jgi:hypothetical protein
MDPYINRPPDATRKEETRDIEEREEPPITTTSHLMRSPVAITIIIHSSTS